MVERVRKSIPSKVARRLWVVAGGRCQYRGCNDSLLEDSLTKQHINKAFISHIIAASPKGPRGDSQLSPELELEYSNLMLLCDECHNRIDEAQVEEHPAELLREMKRHHEKRIEIVTDIQPEYGTNLLYYGAKVGYQGSPINFKDTTQALLPHRYPASHHPIILGLKNRDAYDHENDYWEEEARNLERTFASKVNPIIEQDCTTHFSLFSLAPQPLLMKLGTLLTDKYDVDVFQLHREPKGWCWPETPSDFDGFEIIEPDTKDNVPCLSFSLSARIANERITRILDQPVSIWEITHASPNNDFLKSRQTLSGFRSVCRRAMSKIKEYHKHASEIQIFPAMPIATAVEFGRVWMPKADLDLDLYDINRKTSEFEKMLEIRK